MVRQEYVKRGRGEKEKERREKERERKKRETWDEMQDRYIGTKVRVNYESKHTNLS